VASPVEEAAAPVGVEEAAAPVGVEEAAAPVDVAVTTDGEQA